MWSFFLFLLPLSLILADSCDVLDIFKSSISSCYDFYCEEKEDKLGWSALSNKTSPKWSSIACPENWKYRTEDNIGSYKSKGAHSLYSGGGYVANLGYDDSTAQRILKDLVSNGWIDHQTRAVLVELSMFNVVTNLLVDVTLYFEMLPSGFLATFMRIQVIPVAKSDSAASQAYLVIILLFAFVLGYYLVTECIRAYCLRCSYFKTIWNWLEMLQIISALLVVAFSIERERSTLQVLQKVDVNPFVSVSFHDALFWFEVENYMICITMTIATLRLLRLFKFNNHTMVLFQAVRRSLKPTMSYAVVFFIIFIAYGHGSLLIFGKNVYMFSSFYRIIPMQFLMCLGASVPHSELESVHVILARLYASSFLFMTMIILINMFVAILNDAHSDSVTTEEDSEDMEIANLLLSKFLKLVGITKKRQDDSCSENGEEETSNANNSRKKFASSTKPNRDEETGELNLSTEVRVGMTETETKWGNEPSEQLGSSVLPANGASQYGHAMPSTSWNSSENNREPSGPLGGLFLAERKALPSKSCSSFHSWPFGDECTSTVIRDKQPSNVHMVHFGKDIHVRHYSITSSNLSIVSVYDHSLSETPGMGTAPTEDKPLKPGKSISGDESEGITAARQTYRRIHQGSGKQEKMIDFDEVSEWLKKINISGNVSNTTSDLSKEMKIAPSTCHQVRKRRAVDFDALSRMIKTKRKARKERACESKTTQLEDRVKRIDKLISSSAFWIS